MSMSLLVIVMNNVFEVMTFDTLYIINDLLYS